MRKPCRSGQPGYPIRISYHKYNRRVHTQIREFRRSDFDELWRIDQECFEPGISYSRMELDHYVRRRRAFTLVAETISEQGSAVSRSKSGTRAVAVTKSEPRIVGFIVVEEDSKGVGHVITIDVRAEARRSGVGTQLMNMAEDRLRATGCHAVFLETAVDNIKALSFYKRHGYSVLKTIPRYYQNNVDALLLGKRLQPNKTT